MPWFSVFIFSPFEVARGVASKEGVAKKKGLAKKKGVAQAQAPLKNMTEEKRTIYEMYAKVKRRCRNQVWYSKVDFTSNVRYKWE